MSGDGPTISKNTRNLARVIEANEIDLVIDVGAFEGQYGRRLRETGYGGRIVSIEPLPAARDVLARAVAADPLWDLAPPFALADGAGEAVFHVSGNGPMSSLLEFRPEMAELLDSARHVERVTVETRPLDAVFAELAGNAVSVMLKVDAQGAEERILDGASDVLDRLVLIQLELSIVPVYQGAADYRRIVDRLAERDFEPVLFIPGYFNRRTARLIEMDGIFRRRLPSG